MRKSAAGFTLIELMIVVSIIGILAAIAIPQFADTVAKSDEAVTKGNLGTIRSALSIYYSDNEGVYPVNPGNLTNLTIGARYLQTIPYFYLPKTPTNAGHSSNNNVTTGNCLPGGLSYLPCHVLAGTAATEFPEWVFDVGGSADPDWGVVIIGCSHSDIKSQPWYTY